MPHLAAWIRRPFVAIAIVTTLALGIGAATAVYAVVEAVILRALPVREPHRLVWMWNARVERDQAPFSALDLSDYRDQNTVLDGLAPFINWTANLTGTGDAERLEGVRVDTGFFNLLGVAAAHGRTFGETDLRSPVAVVTDRLWQRRFGADSGVIGRQVSLNGVSHTIVGVLPAGFVFPFREAEIAVPLVLDTDPRRRDRGAGFLRVVARLKPGVTIEAAKANLDRIGARLQHDYPDANAKKLGVNLYPLDREIVGDARGLLLTLLAAVGVLLLVACANIANLLFVALASRRREMSMRTALGATRWRLGRQLLGEVAVLVVIGGTGGVFIGRALARVLVWWGGSTLPRLDDVGLTPGVVSVAVGLTAAATLVCGVLPAWLFSDAPAFALVDDPRTTAGSTAQYRLRRGFVAVQIAAALMLLVAMLLTVRSFNRLQAVEPGFDGRNVLSAQLALAPARYARPEAIIAFADALHRQVVALPGVRSASAISLQPLSGLLSTQDYRVAGHPDPPPDEIPQAHYRIVMPGYFATMGIHVDGRDFSADDRETTRSVAIISKTFATRHWESESPIGEHLLLNGDTLEIVGVCADVKQFGLEAGSTADLYVPLKQMPANQAQFVAARMYLIVGTTGDPSAVADAVRGEVRRLDKDVAASRTRPMSAILSAAVGPRRFNTDLVAIAGATSVVLALVGVYAVTAFSIGRRTREIAIRLALGAQPTQAVRPVLAEEWTAIVGGLCVGASGAALLSRALSSTLFDAAGVEPLVIGAAAVMLGLAAIVATLVPARRIWRADPLVALRTD